jgi:hypothetical protein
LWPNLDLMESDLKSILENTLALAN